VSETPTAESAEQTVAQTGGVEIAEPSPARAPEHGADALVPERIGRYVVLRRLGAGAMGMVVTAYDPELDRQVAIKLIHPRVAAREDARARLLREAKGLARLSHPNVVQIHDAGTVNARVFIAMELVDGQPLSRWREQQERSIEEVLAVYTQAGRGLAAAHDAGLVHRDFKPDNVLVDRDGRARVLDFGLVRATDDGEPRERAPVSPALLIGTEPTLEVDLGRAQATGALTELLSSSELELELTHGGQIMGTPAYMSPEQWKGSKADARSDQFSFCVALWEALYGERPFAGRTVQALAASTTAGTITEPSTAVRLPRRLRAALERGLRPDPAARFEHMNALLHELQPEDWSRSSLALGVGALALFALLAWIRYGTPAPAPAPVDCSGAGDRIASVWSPSRAASIRESFAATGVPSETIATELGKSIDAYAERWRAEARDNCEATHVLETQSEVLLELRERCLDRRLGELEALLEVFARADESTVDEALFAVESLPSLRSCTADRASASEQQTPKQAALAASVSEARRKLAGARASFDTGRFVEATARIDALEPEIDALDFRPLTIEFQIDRGRLLGRIDRFEEASASMQAGFFGATAMRDDELAVRAAISLAELEGAQRQRAEIAALWAEQARALLEREDGASPELAADLADTVSWNAYLADDYAGARREAEHGLALLDAAKLDAPMRRMALLLDRGAAEYIAGDLAAAEASFVAALELAERTVGRDNAKATGALNNLAVTYSARGEYERARTLLEESLATRERALGPDNTSVGIGASNLADVELELGRAGPALEAAARGLAILQASLGPKQYATIIARQRLGLARALAGQLDDALLDLQDALAAAEDPAGPDASLALELHADLAVVLTAAGRLAEREQMLARVRVSNPTSWRELVAAGRYAITLGQPEIADILLSLALDRAGDPPDAGARRTRALAKLALARIRKPTDPAGAAALLTGEIEQDLSGAPKLLSELERLRR
jgi:serine/threonine protein kinase